MKHTRGWRAFVRLCAQAASERQLAQVFDVFFTLAEKEDIAARYEIVRALLCGGATQRGIAEALHVSLAKVTRGSNALRLMGEETARLLRDDQRHL